MISTYHQSHVNKVQSSNASLEEEQAIIKPTGSAKLNESAKSTHTQIRDQYQDHHFQN